MDALRLTVLGKMHFLRVNDKIRTYTKYRPLALKDIPHGV